MTAYELRRHLATDHGVRIVGADYATLITVHNVEHRTPADHRHDDPDQAGHSTPDFLWTISLIVFIVFLLDRLGALR